MMVSTRGRYALRVMIDLAQHNNGGFIPLKEIADRQEISEKYLEGIISALSKAGFVIGHRGKGGGYMLSRHIGTYTVGSILKLTEGSLAPVSCLDCTPNQCKRADQCMTLPMWQNLQEVIENFFDNISLEDLTEGHVKIQTLDI